MQPLTRASPAKINLTLHVRGLRAGGYHEIESLAARVRLCDTISVAPRAEGQWTLECDVPAIPFDERNLALRAARKLAQAAYARGGTGGHAARGGVHIVIQKRIPAGAGLGGGSSNAATTLLLLNELWRLNFSGAELARIGAEIGSDVALFFHSPLCILRGRGEQIEDCPQRLNLWVALLLPELHCATPAVYAAWDRSSWPRARPAAAEILKLAAQPFTTALADALMPKLFNDLEEAAGAVNPALSELMKRVRLLSDGPVRMTGSGAALFRLFDDEAAAQDFARQIHANLNLRTEVVRFETETASD